MEPREYYQVFFNALNGITPDRPGVSREDFMRYSIIVQGIMLARQ